MQNTNAPTPVSNDPNQSFNPPPITPNLTNNTTNVPQPNEQSDIVVDQANPTIPPTVQPSTPPVQQNLNTSNTPTTSTVPNEIPEWLAQAANSTDPATPVPPAAQQPTTQQPPIVPQPMAPIPPVSEPTIGTPVNLSQNPTPPSVESIQDQTNLPQEPLADPLSTNTPQLNEETVNNQVTTNTQETQNTTQEATNAETYTIPLEDNLSTQKNTQTENLTNTLPRVNAPLNSTTEVPAESQVPQPMINNTQPVTPQQPNSPVLSTSQENNVLPPLPQSGNDAVNQAPTMPEQTTTQPQVTGMPVKPEVSTPNTTPLSFEPVVKEDQQTPPVSTQPTTPVTGAYPPPPGPADLQNSPLVHHTDDDHGVTPPPANTPQAPTV